MLILTRKRNESIMIGKDVEIVVLEIRGSIVRIGIKAPVEVQVDRKELREGKEGKS